MCAIGPSSELTQIDTGNQGDRQDATFVLRPALNGNPDAVSFEAVNYPGFFLRHQDFRLKLMQNDNSPLYKDDASFFKRAPLAGGAETASFESANFAGYYIRHRDFRLWVEKSDGSDLFKGTRPSRSSRVWSQQGDRPGASKIVASPPAPPLVLVGTC
jgi:hypothetical protein